MMPSKLLKITLSEADKVEILRRTSLFAGLTDEELCHLAQLAHTVRLGRHEHLFLRGDAGNKLYIVIHGVIRIGSIAPDGREVTLNLIKEGQVFGEIAALDGSARTADATAVDEAHLLAVNRTHLLGFLTTNPEACLRMMAALCDRLRWISGLLDDANFLDLRSRLGKRLLVLGQLFGTPRADGSIRISLILSQQDLASHIGATRESVNKLIKQWEAEGLIAYDGRRLVIKNPQQLDQLIERQ